MPSSLWSCSWGSLHRSQATTESIDSLKRWSLSRLNNCFLGYTETEDQLFNDGKRIFYSSPVRGVALLSRERLDRRSTIKFDVGDDVGTTRVTRVRTAVIERSGMMCGRSLRGDVVDGDCGRRRWGSDDDVDQVSTGLDDEKGCWNNSEGKGGRLTMAGPLLFSLFLLLCLVVHDR
jgi:hypothetical protein